MDNNRKGIGWFTLELYTPTPQEITTNMEVGIDIGTNSSIGIDNKTNGNIDIDTKTSSCIEIDISSHGKFSVKTKTDICEER